MTSIEDASYYVLPSCLHKLYDADVLDEAVILRWYTYPHEISEEHAVIREENRTLLRKTPVSKALWFYTVPFAIFVIMTFYEFECVMFEELH